MPASGITVVPQTAEVDGVTTQLNADGKIEAFRNYTTDGLSVVDDTKATQQSTNQNSYQLVGTYDISGYNGDVKFQFELLQNTGSQTVYCDVRLNGVSQFTKSTMNTSWTEFTDTVTGVSDGDTITVYIRTSDNGGSTGYIRNLYIIGTLAVQAQKFDVTVT